MPIQTVALTDRHPLGARIHRMSGFGQRHVQHKCCVATVTGMTDIRIVSGDSDHLTVPVQAFATKDTDRVLVYYRSPFLQNCCHDTVAIELHTRQAVH